MTLPFLNLSARRRRAAKGGPSKVMLSLSAPLSPSAALGLPLSKQSWRPRHPSFAVAALGLHLDPFFGLLFEDGCCIMLSAALRLRAAFGASAASVPEPSSTHLSPCTGCTGCLPILLDAPCCTSPPPPAAAAAASTADTLDLVPYLCRTPPACKGSK